MGKDEFEVIGEEEFYEEGEEGKKGKGFSRKVSVGSLLVLLVGLVFALLGIFRFVKGYRLDSEVAKVRAESEKYRDVEKKVKELKEREELVKSMLRRIKELQETRKRTIEFFFALEKLVPSGVTLSSIEKKGLKVRLSGYARSSDAYSRFITALNNSGYFSQKIEESRNREGNFLILGDFSQRQGN